MENIKKYYLYLRNLLDESEYQLRIKSVYKFYESTLKKGYITTDKQPTSMFISKIYESDMPIYYLMQVELYLNQYVEQDSAFITRLYPKMNIIGSLLEQLKKTKNFDEKNRKMLRKNNKSVENDLFEICTACLYIKNGYKDIEFLIEQKNKKTPDLRADNLYIECKRKAKECQYSIEERNYWYKQYLPVSEFFQEESLQLVFKVNFKNELCTYSDSFVLNIIKQMLYTYKSNNYDDTNIAISIYPSNLEKYNNERQKRPFIIDKPDFNKILFNYDSKQGGITSNLGLAFENNYKESPNIFYASAGIWYSTSQEAMKQKVVSLQNNLIKAINQIPCEKDGNIHICFESYENKEIEKLMIEQAYNDLNKICLNNKRINNIFIHIIRFESHDNIDSIFEEQVIFFNSYIPKHNLNNMYIFEAENTQPY